MGPGVYNSAGRLASRAAIPYNRAMLAPRRLASLPGLTPALALLIALAALGGGEALARAPSVQAALAPPGIGSRYPQAEVKLAALERRAAAGQPLDCLLIGSSMVNAGLDPAAIRRAYAAQTGRPLTCYNFGVNGFAAGESGLWARALVRRYGVHLLIFGHSARDYASRGGGPERPAWLRYQLGEFAPAGWLIDRSAAARAYAAYRAWPRHDFPARLAEREALAAGMTGLGFTPRDGRLDASRVPGPADFPDVFEALAGYRIAGRDRAGLEALAALQAEGVQVILLEMPIPETYLTFLPDGEASYAIFTALADEVAAGSGAQAWRTRGVVDIPADGWRDYSHLNTTGAQALSAWLGERLATLPVGQAGP